MRLLHVIAAAAALFVAAPAAAQTTSAQLFDLANRVEKTTTRSYALEKEGLTLLREPVKTFNGVTLPTSPAQYMGNAETTLKLTLPPEYHPVIYQMPTTVAASAIKWGTGPTGAPGGSQTLWMKWEAGGVATSTSPVYRRATAMYAALLRAWAWQLKQSGR